MWYSGVCQPAVNTMEEYCKEKCQQMGLTLEPDRCKTESGIASWYSENTEG